jgi:hypothetical protein
MRAFILGLGAACALLASPVHGASIQSADDAATMQIEALQDRWQGRHHYLYDDEYQPGTGTVGALPTDARACGQEPVRLKRSDGSTVIRHLKRCD